MSSQTTKKLTFRISFLLALIFIGGVISLSRSEKEGIYFGARGLITPLATLSSTPSFNPTEFRLTVNSVFAVDPLHTPRPITLLVTPTELAAITVTSLRSTPTPQAIDNDIPEFRVSVENGIPGAERICVFVNLNHFESVDSNINPNTYYLLRNTQVLVDGSIIFTYDDFWVSSINYVENIVNEQGTPVGSYSSPFTLCFDTNDLGLGLHTALLQITIGRNTLYTYTWEFEIAPFSER
jgi:hypothetical protein